MKVYTAQEITEKADMWMNYNGFTGETCGDCKKTANVLARGNGWECDCGHLNDQSWTNFFIPYEHPDMGTPRGVIVEGHEASEKHAELIAVGGQK